MKKIKKCKLYPAFADSDGVCMLYNELHGVCQVIDDMTCPYMDALEDDCEFIWEEGE